MTGGRLKTTWLQARIGLVATLFLGVLGAPDTSGAVDHGDRADAAKITPPSIERPKSDLLAINPWEISTAIRAEMDARRVHGISVGIVAGDKLIFGKGIGKLNAEGARVRLDSLFQIGSITKTFTATLMCALRDKGVLRLDDPVAQYVTDATIPSDPAGVLPITLRHLATHTSGLPNNPVNRRNLPNSPSVMLPYSIDELIAGLENTQLDTPTGLAVRYSNLGYGLLGHALERAADADYEALVRQHITIPLGMSDTRVHLSAEAEERLADHYWVGAPDKAQPRWRFGEVSGFAGLTSNVPDLARYLAFQLGALKVPAAPVSPATLREMQSPQRIVDPNWNRGLGLAWFVEPSEDHGPLVYHGGEVDGHSSFLGFFPDHGVGIVVLANQGGNAADGLGKTLVKQVLAAIRAELDTVASLIEAEEWEAALPLVRTLSERSPLNGRAAFRLGMVLLELDRPDKARAAFETAHRLGFNRPGSEFSIARCLARQGEAGAAVTALRRAYDHGFRDGRLGPTLSDFDGLHDDPRFSALIIDRFPATGQLFLQVIAGGAQTALANLRKSANDVRPSEAAFNRLGYQLLFRDHVTDAIEVFKSNVDAYPNSWNVYDSLGEAYMSADENELAIASYRRSVELNPRNTHGRRALLQLEADDEAAP